MGVMTCLAAILVVVVVGDFASTFFYHVPQHIWGKLHLRTHHDRRRSYWDHAVLSRDPGVLLDGFLGALAYMAVAALCWPLSPAGAVFGLVLGQLHVWWRHTTDLGWVTPAPIGRVCRALSIVTPEDHDGHHKDPDIEFGDLFRFYDMPSRRLIAFVRGYQRRRRNALKRLQRIRAVRALRSAQ